MFLLGFTNVPIFTVENPLDHVFDMHNDFLFVDHRAKLNRDNNSRWISTRMLVDGRPRVVDLYWDDEVELLNKGN